MVRSAKMAGSVELFDKALRQNPYLPKLPWLRNVLRTPYHWIIGRAKDGLPMTVGRVFSIRVPAKYVTREMEDYEVESCVAMNNWLKTNPGGYFVDIGCAFGFMSAGALFADSTVTVIAVDSDIKNIGVVRRLCSLAPKAGARLKLVRALIGSEDGAKSMTMSELLKDTSDALDDPSVTGDPHWTPDHIINLDSDTAGGIPRVSLDRIFADELAASGKACLIKCDVEGGEFIVLKGLKNILDFARPTLMLSVHSQFLPKFGTSVEQIREFLGTCGYRFEVLAIDHEEHWLCTPVS
jgi:FkbM family methyltransferase